jgi:hypothetical protein
MPWQTKERPAPFDNRPIAGLQFLHGDVIAKQYRQEWAAGQKYPLIEFPSGVKREALPGKTNAEQPDIHIFSVLTLPYHSTRDQAYVTVRRISLDNDYHLPVSREGKNDLIIVNPDANRSYRLTYDNPNGVLADIVPYPKTAMELLDGERRAVLPPLYSMEKRGLDAIAPIKFFTPDAGWTWYPTEFDGKDIFFGLVSGLEVELGYFRLSELESVRGVFGLPVERDLYFEPTPLRTLQALHQR